MLTQRKLFKNFLSLSLSVADLVVDGGHAIHAQAEMTRLSDGLKFI